VSSDSHPASFGISCDGAIAGARGSADGSWLAGDCERAVGETMSRFGRADTLASDRARWVPGHILTVNGQTGPVTCEESQASRVSAGARRQSLAGAGVRPPARSGGALRSC
jgi:hypothetical protein